MRWASWLSFSGLTGNALITTAYPARAGKAMEGLPEPQGLNREKHWQRQSGWVAYHDAKTTGQRSGGRGTGRVTAFGGSHGASRRGNLPARRARDPVPAEGTRAGAFHERQELVRAG